MAAQSPWAWHELCLGTTDNTFLACRVIEPLGSLGVSHGEFHQAKTLARLSAVGAAVQEARPEHQ